MTDASEAKKTKVPLWVWVVIGVLVFGGIGSIFGGDENATVSEPPTPSGQEEAAAAQVEDIPSQEPEPESETQAQPEVELTVEDIRESVIPLVFESTRTGIIEVLTEMPIVESVDLYSYDAAAGTVNLDVTPEFDFDDGVRDDAWEFFRLFAGAFYNSGSDNDAWTLEDPRFAPNFRVTVSSATYECEGETMRALAETMLSRANWESTCRLR
jgi:hypothetical protein